MGVAEETRFPSDPPVRSTNSLSRSEARWLAFVTAPGAVPCLAENSITPETNFRRIPRSRKGKAGCRLVTFPNVSSSRLAESRRAALRFRASIRRGMVVTERNGSATERSERERAREREEDVSTSGLENGETSL